MSTVCARCALRIQRAAAKSRMVDVRGFSSTSRDAAVPTFRDTPSAELNEALSTMRIKHFIPSTLSRRDQHYISSESNKKRLEENPLTVDIGGGEEINFTYFNKFDRPGHRELVVRAINLMASTEDGAGWKELPSLLIGLNNMHSLPSSQIMAKAVRKAVQAGQAGAIIECLKRSRQTGMTLKEPAILEGLVWNIRDVTRRSGWEEKQIKIAMSEFKLIADLIESPEHGGGRKVTKQDPRARPEIIGIFTETAAVRAEKFSEGQDADGSVQAFASRLLSALKMRPWTPSEQPKEKGPQYDMLYGSSIYHGLRTAQKILGPNMPDAEQAKSVLKDYQARLNNLEEAIAAQNAKEGTYGEQALAVWREAKASS